MIRTRICENCGNPFETRSSETKLCCHHASLANRRHGMSFTPVHNAWCDMRKRCSSPSHHAWARYGGRGIRVCERWNRFENFLADMGDKPGKEFSIERIDNDGNYEPSNCRWATQAEQTRNRCCSWTAEQDAKLKAVLEAGASYRYAAKAMGRPKGGITRRARYLGLKSTFKWTKAANHAGSFPEHIHEENT